MRRDQQAATGAGWQHCLPPCAVQVRTQRAPGRTWPREGTLRSPARLLQQHRQPMRCHAGKPRQGAHAALALCRAALWQPALTQPNATAASIASCCLPSTKANSGSFHSATKSTSFWRVPPLQGGTRRRRPNQGGDQAGRASRPAGRASGAPRGMQRACAQLHWLHWLLPVSSRVGRLVFAHAARKEEEPAWKGGGGGASARRIGRLPAQRQGSLMATRQQRRHAAGPGPHFFFLAR